MKDYNPMTEEAGKLATVVVWIVASIIVVVAGCGLAACGSVSDALSGGSSDGSGQGVPAATPQPTPIPAPEPAGCSVTAQGNTGTIICDPSSPCVIDVPQNSGTIICGADQNRPAITVQVDESSFVVTLGASAASATASTTCTSQGGVVTQIVDTPIYSGVTFDLCPNNLGAHRVFVTVFDSSGTVIAGEVIDQQSLIFWRIEP